MKNLNEESNNKDQEKESKSKKKINVRQKGNTFEVEVMNMFKQLGYEFCKTSRNASKLYDDCKIDLFGLPINVQVKRGYNKGIVNYHKIKEECLGLIKKNFPKTDSIHQQDFIVIQKQDYKESIVILTLENYLKLLKNDRTLQTEDTK
jgi:hypothetical protein